VANERGRHAEALDYFRRSLAASAQTDSITRKLHALIARCHQELGAPWRGGGVVRCRLATDPEEAELWFRRAVILCETGRPGESEAAFRRVLSAGRPSGLRSQDEGINGHLTLRNLARLTEERGVLGKAAELWGHVLGVPRRLQGSQGVCAACSQHEVWVRGGVVTRPNLCVIRSLSSRSHLPRVGAVRA
jgi:tetratricopeptide (TPR) repeat protein